MPTCIDWPCSVNYQILQANPSIKVRFPSHLTSHKWIVEEKFKKINFSLPFVGVLIILACIKSISRTDLLNAILQKVEIDRNIIERIIDALIQNRLIFNGNSEYRISVQKRSILLNKWKKNGWCQSGEYLWYTWDYPFFDYSKDGGKGALNLMRSYHRASPDTERVKVHKNCASKIQLPTPDSRLLPFKTGNLTNLTNLLSVLSLGFAKKSISPCSWSPVPLIRRTSPSGGSRHPTEGYILVIDIPELQPGWYHIQIDPSFLVSFGKDLKIEDFTSTFPQFQRAKCAAIIILTCLFERNMWRYREPRTFRSVHMDVGHILGTLEMIGRSEHFSTKISYNINESKIAQELGFNLLEEGIIACMAIGVD